MPLIVDTDMGADDIMAILYILRDPAIDVQAIAVSGTGLAHGNNGAQNLVGLLDAMGRPDIPVAVGRSTPMAGDRAFPADWRTGTDGAYGLRFEPVPMTPVSAVDLISSTITSSDTPVTILTLGPLTNLGEALTADPALAAGIALVHVSGGAIDVPGNVAAEGGDSAATAAEWNLWIDPKADDVVFRAGIPITLVPLDATTKLPLTTAFTERLAGDTDAAGADIVHEVLSRSPSVVIGTYFWDQLTAVLLSDPASATFEAATVRVETEGPNAGSTVRDPNGVRVRSAVEPDAARFETRFLEGLRRGGPRPEPFTIAGSIPARFDGATCGGGPPTAIAPGTYTIEAEFTADGESAVVLVRLHPGATWDDLVRYAADASHEVLAQPDFIDVVGSVGSPGFGTVDQVVDLEAGLYGFACFSDGSTPIATLAAAPFTVGE